MIRRTRTLLLLPVLAGVLAACGDGSTAGPAPGTAGAAAVDHGLAPDWALLSVPTGGGTASLHPLADPGSELWSGAVSLPPLRSAVRVAPRLLALRGAEGEVHRYAPGEDAVSSIGRAAGEMRWSPGDDAGVWYRSGGSGGTLWGVSSAGLRRRDVERPVRWASPAADGATVALLASEPATLVRWSGEGSEPEASLEMRAGPPAVATGWGRLAALTRTDATGVLQLVSLTGALGPTERIRVGGPVTALAASPSSHQIYAGVGKPPRLVIADRFGDEVRTRARFQRRIREIRPGVAGGPPVVWDGRAAYLVPWDGGEPVRLRTEWRPDLPLSLPDGSALVIRDGAVERALAGGAASSSGPADRLWIPLRWRAEARSRRGADDTAGAAGARAAAETAGEARRGGTGGTAADSLAADTAGLGPGLEVTEAGFYVILGWERSHRAIEERLRPVRDAGFPVGVQTRRDDAGRRWFRGLVGPYARRSRAEQVARTLQRERGVEGWVQEVRPGLLSDEVFR